MEARRAWFAGRGAFQEAFPDLAADPLNRRAVLQGRLALLDGRGVERARERTSSVPDLEPRRRAVVADQLAGTHEAEAEADELERRLLLGVLAGLELHPALEAGRLAHVVQPWRLEVERELPEGLDDEATRARLVEKARAAAELQRFDALVRSLLLSVVGPGSLPDPAADLAAIEARLTGAAGEDPGAAAARLELLAPFLDDEARQRVDGLLARWWGEDGLERARQAVEQARAAAARPAAEGSTIEQLEAELASRREALAAAEREAEAAAGSSSDPDDVRRRIATLRLEAARVHAEAGERRLLEARAAAGDIDSADALRLAQEEAQRAVEEAEAARATAADARERRRAEVLAAVARASERTATLGEALAEARARAQARDDELAEQVAAIQLQSEQIRTLSAFDADRPSPDAVYRSIRELTMQLRGDPAARGELLAEAQARRDRVRQRVTADRLSIAETEALAAETDEEEAKRRLLRAVRDWEDALTRESDAAEALVEAATNERDATLRALQQTREARRQLAPWISAQEQIRDRGYLLEDVGQELALLGPTVVTMARDRLRALVRAPAELLDFNVIRGLVVESFWTFALFGAWLWGRGEVDRGARWLTERIHRLRPEMRPADVEALRGPLATFLKAFVDLLLGWSLVGRLGELVPELGFVLLVYLQVALYRALLAFFDLAVVRATDVRPGLLVLREGEYGLARITVRAALSFVIARRFALFLLWDVLGLDVITRLAATLFTLGGVGLVGWALYAWEPALRARVARRQQANQAVAWLAKADDSAALKVVRSTGVVGFFVITWVVDLFYLVARERSSIGRLFNAVNRYRLKDDPKDLPRLPEALAAAIASERTPADRCVPRPEVDAALGEAVDHWRAHRRQGMVALVGDRGAGKRTACAAVVARLEETGLPVTRAYLERRLVSERDMLGWLAEVAGVEEPADADALVAALEALPPRAFVLEGLHRAFSRRVGGFAAMTVLLYVQNATCDVHFFVTSFHRPAWDFLASIGSIVDMGVFRTVIRLQPLTSAQLRALTVARAELAGLTVDFGALSRPNPLGGDPAVDLERAVNLFYRLLAEASDGNAKVALGLFARCLEPVDAQTVRVHMSAALSTPVIAQLSDVALFVLVALRIQDELDEEELAEVTNIPHGVVRSTVRDLIGRGVLARVADRVRVPDALLPAVSRTLRRRHFLHFGE